MPTLIPVASGGPEGPLLCQDLLIFPFSSAFHDGFLRRLSVTHIINSIRMCVKISPFFLSNTTWKNKELFFNRVA